MRILWFTNTPSLYDRESHYHYGGGWIESLEELITEEPGVELAISFLHPNDNKKIIKGKTTYYPICRPAGRKQPFRQLIRNWRRQLSDANYANKFIEVINDFKPDVIHVFGSEGPFGEIQSLTKTPVVIHLQGLIGPSLNAYFPPGCSANDFYFDTSYFLKNIKGNSPIHTRGLFERQAEREKIILRCARHVMGRTRWDLMIARLYNPSVKYFHIDEVMRPVFYEKSKNPQNTKNQFQILSTLSPTIYKGFDVVLRSAKQLHSLTGMVFTWKIAGIDADDPLVLHFEKKEGFSHKSVGIECLGKVNPKNLVAHLLDSDVFVHPSYIDNSPNSVCEAQMLGLPVIACDVGGLSTLIQNENTGILVPSNGVFELTHHLVRLSANKTECDSLGLNARRVALQRHNKQAIANSLMLAYNEIARIG